MGYPFDIGDVARLKTVIKNLVGSAIDPMALTFTIKEPDGTKTSYVWNTDAELVREALGTFYVDWPVAQAGLHSWKFVSTGTGASAEEDEFWVRTPKIP